MQFRRVYAVALSAAMVLAVIGVVSVTSAAGNALRLDPATASVAKDGTFTIKVIQSAGVATSGTSATITFDRKIVQVMSVTRGAPFASAPLWLAGDAKAIAAANKSGKLKNVAAAFFPPTSIPAGDVEFLIVEFKAIGCGSVKMTVPQGASDATILDGRAKTFGATLKMTTTGTTVTVCDAAPGASVDPNASLDPNASVDPNASPDPNASVDPNASLDPNASVDPGGSAQPDPSTEPTAAASAAVAAPVDDGSSGATTAAQSDWLTFSMGALAIAAAGLATLILVLTVIAIVAAVVGGTFLIRLWRRTAPKDEAAVAAAASPNAAQAASPGGKEATHGSDEVPAAAPSSPAPVPAMAQTLAPGS